MRELEIRGRRIIVADERIADLVGGDRTVLADVPKAVDQRAGPHAALPVGVAQIAVRHVVVTDVQLVVRVYHQIWLGSHVAGCLDDFGEPSAAEVPRVDEVAGDRVVERQMWMQLAVQREGRRRLGADARRHHRAGPQRAVVGGVGETSGRGVVVDDDGLASGVVRGDGVAACREAGARVAELQDAGNPQTERRREGGGRGGAAGEQRQLASAEGTHRRVRVPGNLEDRPGVSAGGNDEVEGDQAGGEVEGE